MTHTTAPDFLQRHPRWCTWQPIDRAGRPTKKPSISTRDINAAQPWSAVAAATRLGFVLTDTVRDNDGYLVCLDLDACVDPTTNTVETWAQDICRRYDTHVRLSPSGTGLHVWLRVLTLPKLTAVVAAKILPMTPAANGNGKRPGIQLFGLGPAQYVTVGPKVLEPHDVATVDDLLWLLDTYAMHAHSLPSKIELPHAEPMDPAAIIEQVRWRNLGPELVDGIWFSCVAEGKSASDAYYRLQILCLETCADGPSVVEALLGHTAWGRGEIDDSRDPSRYARRSWVERDLARVASKTGAASPETFDDLDAPRDTGAPHTPIKPAVARVSTSHIATAARSGRVRWFATEPPEQRWLLRHPDGDGMLPLGKAGLFTAAGGAGKTNAVVQLAIAVATGGRWLRHFTVDPIAPRGVLLLLGEEDAEEVHRRLWRAGRELPPASQDMVEEHVTALGLHGQLCSILRQEGALGSVAPTAHLRAIHDHLAGGEHGLVVLDPLSRFAGFAEKDNEHGTLLVQHLEGLCAHPGRPTVLMVGHSSKFARRSGIADSRGVTGIPDGVRWHATLTGEGLKRASFGWEKNNYGRPAEPLRLVRGAYGMLHAEGADDASALAQAVEMASLARQQGDLVAVEKLVPVVLDYVRTHPGCLKSAVMDCALGRRQLLGRAVESALATGKLLKNARGLHVVELFL